jgi:hypothetical protein
MWCRASGMATVSRDHFADSPDECENPA